MKNTISSVRTSIKLKKPDVGMRRQLIYMTTGVLLGFLLPRATVYGELHPFGIGLAAAVSGPGTVLVFLAAAAGYLTQGMADSLRYLAALATVAGIRWSVSGFTDITRTRLFASVTAFLGTVITGGALILTASPSALAILTILSESVLVGGFAYFVATIDRDLPNRHAAPLSPAGEISVVMVSAVAMMALYTVEFGGIAPARILAVLLILLSARCGKWGAGSAVGIALGTALMLSVPSHAFLVSSYALGGFLAGLFYDKGKWLLSVLMVLSVGVVAVVSGDEATVILSLYEAGAAGLLFLVLPPAFETAMGRVFRTTARLPQVRSARQAASQTLSNASRAMHEVAGTVDTVSSQLAQVGAPEPGSMYHAVAEEICRTCHSRDACWQRNYADTADAFNHLTPLLRQNGVVTESDLDDHLHVRCQRRRELCERINAAYREYLVRESAHRRLSELRHVLTDQFAATARLLDEFADNFAKPEWTDTDTAERLKERLQKQGVAVERVLCRVDDRGRMAVELIVSGHYRLRNREAFGHRIGEACGRTFSLPLSEYTDTDTHIAFTERHAFHVSVGTSQLRCDGETLCGDAFECFEDGAGRHVSVLSDGMGSGGRAAVDGAMAAGLAARLIKAGFGSESLLRLINTALMAKSEDETLATLDIAIVDLFTGDLELLKAGAGLSLLYSKGRVTRLADSSLPLGILRELTFARTTDRLTDGDVLVMMSDGVTDNGVDWVETLLREYDRDSGGMQGLAQQITTTAHRMLPPGKSDDITVIALGVRRLP